MFKTSKLTNSAPDSANAALRLNVKFFVKNSTVCFGFQILCYYNKSEAIFLIFYFNYNLNDTGYLSSYNNVDHKNNWLKRHGVSNDSFWYILISLFHFFNFWNWREENGPARRKSNCSGLYLTSSLY